MDADAALTQLVQPDSDRAIDAVDFNRIAHLAQFGATIDSLNFQGPIDVATEDPAVDAFE